MNTNTIFLDVDTQLDFLCPAGALYAPGAEIMAAPLLLLTRHAARHKIRILSTVDAHSENDAEFAIWKPHCVVNTAGQQKLAATKLETFSIVTSEPDLRLADADLAAPQIIIEKQQLDCFSNPHLRPLLERFGAHHYVVYGLVTEYCVQCAAFGLLQLPSRPKVTLVSDAIQSLDPLAGQATLSEFTARGGQLASTASLVSELTSC